jgi:hypothetical protein
MDGVPVAELVGGGEAGDPQAGGVGHRLPKLGEGDAPAQGVQERVYGRARVVVQDGGDQRIEPGVVQQGAVARIVDALSDEPR